MKKAPSAKAGKNRASRVNTQKKQGSYSKKPKVAEGHKAKPAKQGPKPDRRPAPPRRESMNRRGILLWGFHAVREAFLNPERTCYRLWTTAAAAPSLEEVISKAGQMKVARPDIIQIEKSDLEHFLPPGCVHQGIALEVEPLPVLSLDEMLGRDDCPEIVIVLDQVTDPHNVGAILRSAAAFGAGGLIVTERGAPTLNGLIAKTACGGAEHVPLMPVTNLARALEALKQENFWCVGLAEEGSKELCETKLGSGRIALVLGAEGEGMRRLTRAHCDELARLPTLPPIGSLNVSNAAAISLYEIQRQRMTR